MGDGKQISVSHGTLGYLPTVLLDRLFFATFLGLEKIRGVLHFTSLLCTLVFLYITQFCLAFSINSSKDIFSFLQEFPNPLPSVKGLFLMLSLAGIFGMR